MARKPTQKALWNEAAKEALEKIKFLIRVSGPPLEEARLEELDRLIPQARSYGTSKGRNEAYDKTFRDRIGELMQALGLVERASKRSFARLEPDFSMKKNGEGKAQLEALCAKYGVKWGLGAVQVEINHYPELKFETDVMGPNEDGDKLYLVETEKRSIPAHIETIYTFVLRGTTAEEIEWTKALGNKPKVVVDRIPARVKAGKPRKGQKK